MLDPIAHVLQPDEAIAFLQELVRINSVYPGGDEAAVAAAVARRLQADGIPADLIPLGAPRRANALGRLKGAGQRPALLFSGHSDVVPPGDIPWQHDPWSATLEGGRLYGRGSVDMKGGLAAMVMAACLLSRAGIRLGGDLLVAATAGEEVDLAGARALVRSGALQDVANVVIGEPTELEVVIAHRGVTWVEIATLGHTAHSSVPHEGTNAVVAMGEVLRRLNGFVLPHTPHPTLGGPSLSPNIIRGGNAMNVVPDRCSLQLDIRTVPGQTGAEICAALERLVQDLPVGRAEVKLLTEDPAGATDPGAPLVAATVEVVRTLTGRRLEPRTAPYFTELAVYQPELNVPVVVCGPGEAGQAHQPNESINLEHYLEGIRFFAALAVQVLGTA